jgi:hypothetical protein
LSQMSTKDPKGMGTASAVLYPHVTFTCQAEYTWHLHAQPENPVPTAAGWQASSGLLGGQAYVQTPTPRVMQSLLQSEQGPEHGLPRLGALELVHSQRPLCRG